ncbi:phospholipase D-like domain-containing protein [Myxococcus faecalis]|uniref:phospholipase D-like domain-containing protein n=1 Tax=Myxococcus faecalis TaxID=3115646 RepID=UPI003CF73780
MPLSSWQALGTGDVLGHLRADLKKASSSVWVIGPWIDEFFAQVLVTALPASTALYVVTRPPSGANSSFGEHALSARASLEARPNTVVKLLVNLHAKVIVVDEQIGYCGSANWYRYSLEESREIVLRGPVASTSGLLDEVQVIWEQAEDAQPVQRSLTTRSAANGYTKEVIDPVAEAKLKEVPGSFVLNRKPRRR